MTDVEKRIEEAKAELAKTAKQFQEDWKALIESAEDITTQPKK